MQININLPYNVPGHCFKIAQDADLLVESKKVLIKFEILRNSEENKNQASGCGVEYVGS